MLQLIRLLRRRPMLVAALARRLNVAPRTIWRDLTVLKAARIPLVVRTRADGSSEYAIKKTWTG